MGKNFCAYVNFFSSKKNYFVKVEIWSDNNFVRQTLGEDLFRQGYVRKTDESLTNRLVVQVASLPTSSIIAKWFVFDPRARLSAASLVSFVLIFIKFS